MQLALLLFALLQSALAQDQWRLVHQDGSIEKAWGAPRLTPEDRSGLQAAWVWSGERVPRRIEKEMIGRERLPRDTARLNVRVARQSRSRPPADLRVIAAPISMWRDLPEDALPSWPVPANGRLGLPHDPRERWRLRVAGQGEGSWWVDVQPGRSDVLLWAEPADDLRIEVVGAEGAAVGRVAGTLMDGEPRAGGQRAWTSTRSENGRIDVPALPDRETVTLSVISVEHAPAIVQGHPPDLPSRIRLETGGTLFGRLSGPAGKPLSGAAVRVETWASPRVRQVVSFQGRSRQDGHWSVSGLPAGPAVLQIQAPGLAPLTEPVEVVPGTLDVGARQLLPGVRLSVEVVDEEESPVAGAEVSTVSGATATADSRGIAVLSGLPAAPVEIRGTAKHHRDGKARVNPPFTAPVHLELKRAATLTGRLVDETGTPISQGTIQVNQPSCFSEHDLDGAGRFDLDLPAGEPLELVLRSPGAVEVRRQEAPGRPGEVRDLGDLVAQTGLTVSGRVVDAQGTPVPGARVWLPRPGTDGPVIAWARRDLLQAATDLEGNFRLTGLPPGPALLRIDAAGFARTHLDLVVEPPGSDAGDVRLSAGGTLRILVPDAPAGSLARADLRSLWLDLDFVTAEVRESEATFRHLPPGRLLVSVLADRKLLCEKEIDLAEGADQDTVCSRRSMTVRGTVRVGGVPAGPGILSWQSPRAPSPGRIDQRLSPAGVPQQEVFGLGRPQVDVAVAADGSFATGELDAGTWKVLWQPMAGSATGEREVEISRSEQAEVLLDFPGLMLSGTVLGEDGEPVAGARVRELESGALAFSSADGSFRLPGPEHGARAVLQAELQELASEPVTVALEPDRIPEPVQLTLGRQTPPRIDTLVVDADGRAVSNAFVFLEEDGRGFRILTTGVDGRTTAAMTPPFPARVRLAASSGMSWYLGDWMSWDEARSGLTAILAGTAAIEVVSEERSGNLHVASPNGWDVALLLASLGVPPMLRPGAPLRIDGLPAGIYAVTLDGHGPTVVARVGEITQARIE